MIYFGYGMWNSSLELSAREEEAHASSYQRYDAGVDESFTAGDDLHPQDDGDGGRYQGWAAEERGNQYQNQHEDQYQNQYQDQYQDQHQDQCQDQHQDQYQDQYQDQHQDQYQNQYQTYQ